MGLRPYEGEGAYMMQKSLNQLINWGITLLSTAILLLLFEGWVRVSGQWIKAPYEERTYYQKSKIMGVPYHLKPDTCASWARTTIRTNHLGIRDRKPVQKRDASVSRILCIGDSITFGLGVDQDETYPARLERLLNQQANGKRYEVVNAGISGFNANDEANFLSFLFDQYDPDLIVWLIVENDYDDSLSVNDQGQMIHGIKGYAATNDWLVNSWGLSGPVIDPDNFLAAMSPRYQAWARGMDYHEKESVANDLEAFLSSHSYLFCLLRSRVKSLAFLKPPIAASCDTSVIVRNIPIVNDHVTDMLPEFASIFISPYYQERFLNAIKKGIGVAATHHRPMVILPVNMLVEVKEPLPSNVYIREVSPYFGEPLNRFRIKNNLGWDGHFNKKGNKLLASAVMRCLSDLRLIPVDKETKAPYYHKEIFWDRYRAERALYIQRLKPWIDFSHFSNIHQIVGGLYPSCEFPIKDGARLSIILGNIESPRFRMAGINRCKKERLLTLMFYSEKHAFSLKEVIKPGAFDLPFLMPDDMIHHKDVVDLHLLADDDGKCGPIKLSYIGQERIN